MYGQINTTHVNTIYEEENIKESQSFSKLPNLLPYTRHRYQKYFFQITIYQVRHKGQIQNYKKVSDFRLWVDFNKN